MFHEGELLALSGRPQIFGHTVQFTHPEFDRLSRSDDDEGIDWGKALHTGSIVPQYRSTEELKAVKLDSRGFRRILKNLVEQESARQREILTPDILRRCSLYPLGRALSSIHFPPTMIELEQARRRLKFDELFFLQLLLAFRRREIRSLSQGISFDTKSAHARRLVDSLPFQLTRAQKRVIREIACDMESDKPMNRLLQGDVGSGKTIVALIAMLIAIDSGYQAAFMAPTEILAAQHYVTLTNILGNMGITIRLLLGGQKQKVRNDILEDVRKGQAQIVIGTHALIQEQVQFASLGLIIIDEQHRFGVVQRVTLREKGRNPDVLVMTATPIPRTLSMTVYGDLDVSVIDELPKSRKPITTVIRSELERPVVYEYVRSELKKGRQVYVVYPLIEESEKIDLEAAKKNYGLLKDEVFPDYSVGLIHGKMTSEERSAIMHEFRSGKISVLVATTVIEVGIDVPNATIMVIENAERFGLAQLHQLRGRVGRGTEQSMCILLGKVFNKITGMKKGRLSIEDEKDRTKALRRLEVIEKTTDGFAIAEVDLELRGPGEYFGTKQSGLPELRIANILTDHEILNLARREAFSLVEDDPQLRHPGHASMKKYFLERFKEHLSFVRVG
jgi:ATP-dependent DNA helicase RecG